MRVELSNCIINHIPSWVKNIIINISPRGKFGPTEKDVVDAIISGDILSLIVWANMNAWVLIDCFVIIAQYSMKYPRIYLQYSEHIKRRPSGVKDIKSLQSIYMKYDDLVKYEHEGIHLTIYPTVLSKTLKPLYMIANWRHKSMIKTYIYDNGDILDYASEFYEDFPQYRCIWKIRLILLASSEYLNLDETSKLREKLIEDSCKWNCNLCIANE